MRLRFMRSNFICAFTSMLMATMAVSSRASAQFDLSKAKVSVNGIGPVLVGMTVPEAEAALGLKLLPISQDAFPPNPECYYAQAKSGPEELRFMVSNWQIVRVDIKSNSRMTTLSGAKIGDTEEQIKALFPGQITVRPHEYATEGHLLEFVPRDSQYKNYRIVFETDGERVMNYQAGEEDAVFALEGCV